MFQYSYRSKCYCNVVCYVSHHYLSSFGKYEGTPFGFCVTKFSKLLSYQIVPQLHVLCRLVGRLASFGLEEDFCPKSDSIVLERTHVLGG
jgi:hypothetical protein